MVLTDCDRRRHLGDRRWLAESGSIYSVTCGGCCSQAAAVVRYCLHHCLLVAAAAAADPHRRHPSAGQGDSSLPDLGLISKHSLLCAGVVPFVRVARGFSALSRQLCAHKPIAPGEGAPTAEVAALRRRWSFDSARERPAQARPKCRPGVRPPKVPTASGNGSGRASRGCARWVGYKV